MSTAEYHSSLVAPTDFDFRLDAKTIYRSLLGCVIVLALSSTAAKFVMLAFPAEQYGAINELCKRVYLDFENNIPAWFSSIGLFTSSALFGFIAAIHSRQKMANYWHWLGLSVLFLALAIDEATYIHEILIVSLRNKLHLTGIFYFAWVIPGAFFVLGVGALYCRFVFRLPTVTRNGLFIAGACYVGGALGMELLGGMLAESRGFDSLYYVGVMTLEETLELLGIITLIYVLLRHIGMLCPNSLQVSVQ